ncbi:MAG: bifunctional 1-(5-phosphoribosyl)-5-((5-phosphoribosylamino)methylideneamino)imidazole-4-carboxamide isomerase/phosphoribosylanthranilate isomerase PriA [Actinobacteria bacterium]|nr:bifunctional 1-(5-phosphoribosyl)-5-((5-phosphoribosylamino)methylideneamino)imidazole-4-carboxamide isomerase/phosphoribosylanthranilate isomerase PriA [Actinomycetota bacterium]
MDFEVIPAIDLADRRLSRFTPKGPTPIDAFGGDPMAAAEVFLRAGARWIHVVDMDHAFGLGANLGLVREVASLPVRVQAGGGLADEPDVEAVLAAGASRAVLGSAALADRGLVERLCARLGEALVVGLETDGERIRPRGLTSVELPLHETLAWLAGVGASRLLHTQVGRVGELSGPDLDGIAAVARVAGRPVIASGGVATVGHLRALAGLGIEGAVVGRALYEGTLDLGDAIAAVADLGTPP